MFNKESQFAALLGEGTDLEGNFSFDGTVRIAGKVKGTIFSNETVIISDTANIEADISGEVIIISGNVKGKIKASSRVEINKPAYFEGEIESPSLKVEEGVIFHGQTKMDE